MTTAQEYFKDFPEAPFADTFKWVDKDGFEHLVTSRSWSAASLFQGVEQVKELIAKQEGKAPNVRPAQTMQERDENGTPVVNGEGKPVMTNLPDGVGLYTVKQLFHGLTKNKKDYLGVVTVEKPHNRKWGVKCFHPTGIDGWKSWPVGENDPTYYAPPELASRVLIREAKGEGEFPDVLEFQAGPNPF